MPTLRRSPLRLAALAGALLGGLVLSTTAVGAGITLGAPAPEDGAQIQTTSSGVRVPLAWTGDTTGCRPGTSVRVRIDDQVADPTVALAQTPISLPLSGSAELYRSSPVTADTLVTWRVTLSCLSEVIGQPLVEVASETRTFTLLAPDPRPKADGRYNVYLGGRIVERSRTSSLSGSTGWTFRPLCAVGPCRARVNIARVGNVVLAYNAKSGLWSGTLTGARAGRAFVCRRIGSSTRITGAYTGRLTIRLRAKAGVTRVVGSQTRALQLVGTLAGTITPNAKGRALSCPSGKIRGTLKGFAV